ncbi:NAD(P)-dependent oxidoreductase [Nonomuraea angiospora]|uniref:NAD(P)-dependent oxidoreductase n=1 Tax=Nonomuraea angiospora TaxID=46172 RepID=UPI0033257954
MTHRRPKALLAMRQVYVPRLFPAAVRDRIERHADVDAAFAAESLDDPRAAALLPELEVLITGWGCPPLDDAFLRAAPRLRAVLHAAGSVKAHVTKAVSHLSRHDFEIRLYDPYATAASVPRLGLEELLATSDIVSLHAPATPETHHLLDRDRLALLADGAVLINTAQGSLIDTEALIDELRTGRISAVIDVTTPEPLPAHSALFELPNVFLTPHIAGSQGNELARMGAAVADELERLVTGVPLLHRIRYQDLDTAA